MNILQEKGIETAAFSDSEKTEGLVPGAVPEVLFVLSVLTWKME